MPDVLRRSCRVNAFVHLFRAPPDHARDAGDHAGHCDRHRAWVWADQKGHALRPPCGFIAAQLWIARAAAVPPYWPTFHVDLFEPGHDECPPSILSVTRGCGLWRDRARVNVLGLPTPLGRGLHGAAA